MATPVNADDCGLRGEEMWLIQRESIGRWYDDKTKE